MPDPNEPIEISSATKSEMREICRRATADAEDVDPRVFDELYGHLEDRLLGYLSGEDKLSEADAIILVREHFGRANVLRRVLARVHAPAGSAQVALWRRLGAATVVLSVSTIAVFLIRFAVVLTPAVVMFRRGSALTWLSTWYWVVSVAGSFATTACLYVFMRRWRSPDRTQTTWVVRWKPYAFAAALLAAVLIYVVAGQLMFRVEQSVHLPESIPNNEPPRWAVPVLACLSIGAAGLQCLVWIGWVASPARRMWWTPLVGAVAWLGYFPLMRAAANALLLLMPGQRITEFIPWYHLWDEFFAPVVVGPALGLFLIPRAYRWLKSQGPLRITWAHNSTSG